MSLREHMLQLRMRWRWIVGGLALGLLIGVLFVAQSPTQYAATTTVYLSPGQSNNDPIAAYQGALFSEQRMTSYAQLATEDRVAQDVIAELGLQQSVEEVARKLTATTQPNTVLLRITAVDSTPTQAAAIANAATASLGRLVPQLERPPLAPGPYPVNVQVVQPAAPKSTPVSRGLGLHLFLGALGGLLAGLGAAALRNALDDSVRSARHLHEAVDAPVLGVVPLRRGGRRGPVGDFPAECEAYRWLRTNLQHTGFERGVVVVTSATRGDGRTTLVCNLADVMAAGGRRVLVVDTDMRSPRIAGQLGLEPQSGLTDVLAGRVPFTKGIQAGPERAFDVLASGPVPLNPSELVGSQQMADLLEELSQRYDVLLLDSPPLLDVADGAELAALADGTIMICRFGRTREGQLRQGAAALSAVSARLLGAVLTMVPLRGSQAPKAAPEPSPAAEPVLAGTLRPHILRHRAAHEGSAHRRAVGLQPDPATTPTAGFMPGNQGHAESLNDHAALDQK